MDIFLLTLQQLMMMASLMVAGFLLRKKNIVPENTGIAISKLETYIFVPALSIINQLNNCTVETFVNNSRLILYGAVITAVAVPLGVVLSHFFIRNSNKNRELSYTRNVYQYGLTFSNYGFIGNFIILGVWGDLMFYKYTLFTFFLAIASNSWGLYMLIPKGQASLWKNLKKGLTAPPMLALFFGIICGLLNLKPYFPPFVLSALDSASKCMGPAAMLLSGMVMAGYNIRELILNKKVYILTFVRLILIPSAFLIVLKFLGVSEEIMILVLVAFASPLGMNTIVYPAAYGGETKTGASMIMISSTFCIITLPLMYYLFVVIL